MHTFIAFQVTSFPLHVLCSFTSGARSNVFSDYLTSIIGSTSLRHSIKVILASKNLSLQCVINKTSLSLQKLGFVIIGVYVMNLFLLMNSCRLWF